MGRKSTFNDKDAAEIVARLSKGEPLAVICRDEWLPTDRTVRKWADNDAAFASDIARAREAGHDAIANDALDIADGLKPIVLLEGDSPSQRDRLRVETRLKLLAKWDPKRYGDLVKLAGADGGAIATDNVHRWADSPEEATEDPSR